MPYSGLLQIQPTWWGCGPRREECEQVTLGRGGPSTRRRPSARLGWFPSGSHRPVLGAALEMGPPALGRVSWSQHRLSALCRAERAAALLEPR